MKKMMILGCLLILALAARSAHASLSFDPARTFSGTAPDGSLTANFTDVSGGVQLVITSYLAAGENLDPGKALYFNFNPQKYSILPSLSFTLTGNTNFNQSASVLKGADSFKADGDGLYDINFTYTPGTKAFGAGESQTYFITTRAGVISASDFTNYLSATGGGNGTWAAAVHVQNTPSGQGGSAWVGAVNPVPVPAAVWLFGSGAAALSFLKQRMVQRGEVARETNN